MNFKEWRPIEHWLKSFGLKLKEQDAQRFSKLCVIFAKDRRFKGATGYAKVWSERHPQGIELFAPNVACAVVEGIHARGGRAGEVSAGHGRH